MFMRLLRAASKLDSVLFMCTVYYEEYLHGLLLHAVTLFLVLNVGQTTEQLSCTITYDITAVISSHTELVTSS